MESSKVYFTKEITPESLIKIYEAIGKELTGKIAVKISTGEPGGHNFLSPNLIKNLVKKLDGTIVECNTAYAGRRNTSEEHWKAIKEHGFLDIANVDIMDENGDMAIPVRDGIHLKENYVGSNLRKYDSMLMLSHFKGHAMGGFGGALKNMSIGVSSSAGKAWIHSAGKTKVPEEMWANLPEQDYFLESMAEADSSVIDYMKGNIIYINVINNLSVDCDCDSNPEAPCMADIGIVGSLDPVAIDKASLDFIYNSDDSGRDHFIERVESRHGIRTIEHAEELGIGTTNYKIIEM
ncbi:MAG: DUF362 domain-containing protein [Clostridia bacterium]|jgi:uncharacterized Fe-S center protein|nr:DUF362 domain-containing protein [Clostridia bacterium]